MAARSPDNPRHKATRHIYFKVHVSQLSRVISGMYHGRETSRH